MKILIYAACIIFVIITVFVVLPVMKISSMCSREEEENPWEGN